MLYFGIVRERLGRREEDRQIGEGSTVGDLVAELARTDDLFALGAGSIRIAVNREYVGDSHALADGDEVAVIPPVAGGIATSLSPGDARATRCSHGAVHATRDSGSSASGRTGQE
jgi:molybdopterin converting factor subunit 1